MVTISDTSTTSYIHQNYSMTVKFGDNISYKYPNGSIIRFQGSNIILSDGGSDREAKLINIYARNYE